MNKQLKETPPGRQPGEVVAPRLSFCQYLLRDSITLDLFGDCLYGRLTKWQTNDAWELCKFSRMYV